MEFTKLIEKLGENIYFHQTQSTIIISHNLVQKDIAARLADEIEPRFFICNDTVKEQEISIKILMIKI